MAALMVNWSSAEGARDLDGDYGYIFGSRFAWACDGDRKAHLRGLLQARDSFVRVAGAVYLSFEDADAGLTALRQLAGLPGDAGLWAALTLARRGDGTHAPRLLRVFLPEGRRPPRGVRPLLRRRVAILLSNAAARANVPQPPPTEEPNPAAEPRKNQDSLRPYKDVVRWWTTYGRELKLADPWLPELEKLKAD
jgi:hypothetical protein